MVIIWNGKPFGTILIDSNESLSNVQKIVYLKNLMWADTSDIIAYYTNAVKLFKSEIWQQKTSYIRSHEKNFYRSKMMTLGQNERTWNSWYHARPTPYTNLDV